MASSVTIFVKYFLISVLAFSEFTVASDYDINQGQYDINQGQYDSRFPRQVEFGVNGVNQNIDIPNYDVPSNLEIPAVREVRKAQEDLTEDGESDDVASPTNLEEGAPRIERAPVPETIIDMQNIDVINQDGPEIIPDAQIRKVRGNGADLSAEQTIIGSVDAAESTTTPERADIKAAGPCQEDGASCSENSGCCSKFCSWTRGFTCFTFKG